MKINELKNKTESELKTALFDLREELRSLRFDFAYGKVSNVAKIKKIKRDIARTLSVLNDLNVKNKK